MNPIWIQGVTGTCTERRSVNVLAPSTQVLITGCFLHRYVLSAAHCMKGRLGEPEEVLIGETKFGIVDCHEGKCAEPPQQVLAQVYLNFSSVWFKVVVHSQH